MRFVHTSLLMELEQVGARRGPDRLHQSRRDWFRGFCQWPSPAQVWLSRRLPFQESVANPKTINDQLKLIWVGCGTEDRLFPANQQFSEFLTKSGVKNTFRSTEGNHTW